MQPVIQEGRRAFACFPVAVLGFIVGPDERILLLAHPRRRGEWEVVNGALEAGETILEGVLREVAEEAGPDVQVDPLGAFHAYTFQPVSHMVCVCYLLAYRGGEPCPGDDMAGSTARWWSLDELADDEMKLIVPRDEKWLLARAVELYRLWRDTPVELQPAWDPTARTKYGLEQPS